MFIPRSRDVTLRRGRNRGRWAAVAVEFALIAPFLTVCLLGMVELGRAIMVRQVLNDAVRQAARRGILPNTSSTSITANANKVLTQNGIPNTPTATITILVNGSAVDASTAVKGDTISVKVSVPFANVAWLPPLFLTGNSVESETLVMQRQG
jgi:Flp pilus assembly protein TadG